MSAAALLDIAAKLPDDRPVADIAARRMLDAIETARREAGLSIIELVQLADVPVSSYRRYRGGALPTRPDTLRRLARALRRREEQTARDATLLQALAIRALEDLARSINAKQARSIAIYLAHVELGLPQRHLARLYGCSGNYINQVVQRIEAGRDEGRPLDAALLKIGQRLEAGAGAFMRGAA